MTVEQVYESPFYWAGYIDSIFKEQLGLENDSMILNDEHIEELVQALIDAKYLISWNEIVAFFKNRNKPITIGKTVI